MTERNLLGRNFGTPFVFLAIAASVVLGLYSCEVSSTSYASYKEAESREAMGAHKWLPSLIPASARDIRESHDVDSNEVWFMFVFEGNFDPPAAMCSTVNRSEIALRPVNWWDRFPNFVREARTRVIKPGMRLFSCNGESYSFFLAVDETDKSAIGWSFVH